MPQSYRKKRKNKGKGGGKGGGDDQDNGDVAFEGGPQAKSQRKDEPARNDTWQEEGDFERKNDAYEAYYKRMGVCPEQDWPKVVEAYRTGLPVSIRVNRMRTGAASLCERLEEMRKECGEDTDREQYAPHHLTWYPHNSAWQWSGLERRTIKKDTRNKQLKAFLLQRERSGLLSRQETVSMIPPLFLCVEPHHFVLDLCAAPGSKTSQMIETMHWPDKAAGGSLPSGLVIANELQWKRANMLAHQVARMGSPCSAVVNMDAQFYPEHWEKTESGGYQLIKYDRVLCDVPCSGDGTMRKTPYIWRSWTTKDGFSLHFRQLGILYRGIDLLKVGGRLVYSTCSLNPLEDEAVIAAALQRHAGSIVLAAPPDLPGLQAANGLESWEVIDPETGVYYKTYEEVPHERKSSDKNRMLPSMFPPPKTEEGMAVAASINQHCRRMLPHLMDTGGFFVVAFEKIAECKPSARARREGKRTQILEARAEARKVEQGKEKEQQEQAPAGDAVATSAETIATTGNAASASASAGDSAEAAGDAPATAASSEAVPEGGEIDGGEIVRGPPAGMKPMTREFAAVKDEDEAIWDQVRDFYGLDEKTAGRFQMRLKGGDKNIFLISEGMERFLRSETKMPTRLVLCGVPVLKRAQCYQEGACPFQLDQAGTLCLATLGLKRRLTVKKDFLLTLLREKEITLAQVREAAATGSVCGLEALGGDSPRPGSIVIALEGIPCLLAVAADLTEGMLELAVGKEVTALVDELQGQPSVADILRVPEGAEAEGGDEQADARPDDTADAVED